MTTANVRMSVAILVVSACTGSAIAGDLPRYSPKPGQVLNYEENQSFKGTGENSAYRTTWRIWVVGKNDDGSWRMVVRETMKTLGQSAASAPENEMVTLARIDLFPDGKVPRSPMLGTRFDPSHLFPRLPKNDKEATDELASTRRPRRRDGPLPTDRSERD